MLTVRQQADFVKAWFPKAKLHYAMIGGAPAMRFRLHLQPTSTSGSYAVEFVYIEGFPPLVYVVDPKPVKEVHGQPTPHLNEDETLCLFDPGKKEWSPSDPLVRTTVQWAARWLFHYEHWLTFGEWRGDQSAGATPTAQCPATTADQGAV